MNGAHHKAMIAKGDTHPRQGLPPGVSREGINPSPTMLRSPLKAVGAGFIPAQVEFCKRCVVRSSPLLLVLSIAKIEIPSLAHFVRSVGMTGNGWFRLLGRDDSGTVCRIRIRNSGVAGFVARPSRLRVQAGRLHHHGRTVSNELDHRGAVAGWLICRQD